MGFTRENAQNWMTGIIRQGANAVLPKVDQAFVNSAIANAGNVARGVDLEAQSPEQLEALAMKAIDTAPFAEQSGNKEILKAYVKGDLIQNSYKIDEEKGLEKGTSLRTFFENTRDSTDEIDFEAFKKDPMSFMMKQDKKEVERITLEIRGSAHENIKHEILSKDGTKGSRTIEQDYIHSIQHSKGELGQDIYKDVKADEQKPLGGGMMEIIMAFLGMLLGVNLSGLFGGQAPSHASYDERAQDSSPATPAQQTTIDTIEKGIKFAAILKDSQIDKGEFNKVFDGSQPTPEQATVKASMDDHVILTPHAKGDNPGDTVIYAKKDANGKLSDIQVTTTTNGTASVKQVEGDFTLTGDNSKEVGTAIADAAQKGGTAVDRASPNVLVDDIASGLSAALQKIREQATSR